MSKVSSTKYSEEQLNKLEALFKIERYPGIQMCEDLAQELNVGEDRIQVRWLIFSRNITLSLNEKFTTQKSSTLVLAHLPVNMVGSQICMFFFSCYILVNS